METQRKILHSAVTRTCWFCSVPYLLMAHYNLGTLRECIDQIYCQLGLFQIICLQQKSPEEETLLELNLMICLVAHYFDQGDLADKTWHGLYICSILLWPERKRRLQHCIAAWTGQDLALSLRGILLWPERKKTLFFTWHRCLDVISVQHLTLTRERTDITSLWYKNTTALNRLDVISTQHLTFTRQKNRHCFFTWYKCTTAFFTWYKCTTALTREDLTLALHSIFDQREKTW